MFPYSSMEQSTSPTDIHCVTTTRASHPKKQPLSVQPSKRQSIDAYPLGTQQLPKQLSRSKTVAFHQNLMVLPSAICNGAMHAQVKGTFVDGIRSISSHAVYLHSIVKSKMQLLSLTLSVFFAKSQVS